MDENEVEKVALNIENQNKEQAIRILRSWHMVEFFQPYNLPDYSSSGHKLVNLTSAEIAKLGDRLLPWLSPSSCKELGINDHRNYCYILYLRIFDKSLVNDICDKMFHSNSAIAQMEFEQRSTLEGSSCFAKLYLNCWGTPNFETFSVSTLPWALGHLENDRLDHLTKSAFDERCSQLAEALNRIALKLPRHQNNAAEQVLNGDALLILLRELDHWAELSPNHPFAVTLDWYPANKNNKALPPAQTNSAASSARSSQEHTDPHESEEQVSSDDNNTLPILNSFYIHDIERVINSLYSGVENPALMQYLSVRTRKHADLYTDEGLALIKDKLSPEKMPQGRWLSDPKHNMTLMQQFAINTVFDDLKHHGLLSVNGPPGTGKTTILRDIVANNIVNRGKVLATLDHAYEGLTQDGFLIDALCGFEMVVASSNNAAVENISKELPLRSAVADEFTDLDHFKPIANMLNASKTRKGFQPLSDEQQCWGVISAVLGKQGNRKAFVESYFFDTHFEKGSTDELNRPEDFNILNFYRWRDLHKHEVIDFFSAKSEFIRQLEQYEEHLEELKQIAHLTSQIEKSDSVTQQENIALLSKLLIKHPNKAIPCSDMGVSDSELQRNAFWQDEKLNRLRSSLFVAALKLHQSWLTQAMENRAFQQAVYGVRNVIKGIESSNPVSSWQLLFMLVPLISTTFASVGRMFKDLDQSTVGYLLIDEAGQALPQAAVGAIWRSKRVLVVGDPLQIEPVFITPPRLTHCLSSMVLSDDAPQWDPQKWSLQQIADRANPYGCSLNIMQQPTWVGIPLWVHRRCMEPMFSIANAIAYEGRMIHGLESNQIMPLAHKSLGHSQWVDAKGSCSEKQFVPAIAEQTIALLLKVTQSNTDLFSIYIITPFRAVKRKLLEQIERHAKELLSACTVKKSDLNRWKNGNIGTVHTFQGKENDTVILVLGGDQKTQGSIKWASSKPNLLNVALTRAKRNVYVIGDADLWQREMYFDCLAKMLRQLE